MSLHESHITFIRARFQKVTDREGLAKLLTYCRYAPFYDTPEILLAKIRNSKILVLESTSSDEPAEDRDLLRTLDRLVKKSKNEEFPPFVRPIKARQLTYYGLVAPRQKKKLYLPFTIPKASGGVRQILAPADGLKRIQQALNVLFNALFEPHFAAHGFVPNRSIVTNAQRHVGKPHLLNLDLKDFFPSVEFRRVKTMLQFAPFNLKGEREELGFLIANLCCHEGKLPQGAPTSPTLSNLVCQRLDRRLHQLARKYQATYTRYADDLSFSRYDGPFDEAFEAEVRQVVDKENFAINDQKVRQQFRAIRQEVTGLTVNQKVNVNRHYLRATRTMLHNWEKGGLVQATKIFYANYRGESPAPGFLPSLLGRIHFIGMVRGSDDPMYQKMLGQYWALMGRNGSPTPLIDLESLVETWEKQGVAKAFQRLNPQIQSALGAASRPLQLIQLVWQELALPSEAEETSPASMYAKKASLRSQLSKLYFPAIEGDWQKPSLLARFYRLLYPWAKEIFRLLPGEQEVGFREDEFWLRQLGNSQPILLSNEWFEKSSIEGVFTLPAESHTYLCLGRLKTDRLHLLAVEVIEGEANFGLVINTGTREQPTLIDIKRKKGSVYPKWMMPFFKEGWSREDLEGRSMEVVDPVRVRGLMQNLPPQEQPEVTSPDKTDFRRDPRDTVEFLKRFSDPIFWGLKGLVHSHDTGEVFDYDEFCKKTEQEFRQSTKELMIPRSLYRMVESFALRKESPNESIRWNDGEGRQCKEGWRSAHVQSWCDANPGKSPYEHPEFRDTFITRFGNSIRIRRTTFSRFIKDILQQAIDSKDLSIDFRLTLEASLDRVDIRTHVHALRLGIKNLLIPMGVHSIHKHVKVSAWREDEPDRFWVIKITDRRATGEPGIQADAGLEHFFSGNLGTAKERFSGLLFWDIEARFANGCHVLHVLHPDDTKENTADPIADQEVEGVSHILRFYRA